MDNTPSSRRRRSVLAGLATTALGGVTGCLRLEGEPTETEGGRSTPRNTEVHTTSSASEQFEEAWTIPKWGSDVVAFDGRFYVSTWVSKQVYAVAPDGSVEWSTGTVGKYKKRSLAVTDSLVVGCGYGGQVTAFDRATGGVQWDFTEGRYDAWSATPVVTDQYVVGANNVDELDDDDDFAVYVLDRATGAVVERFDYADLNSPVDSLSVLGDKLLVSTYNFVDVYDLSSLSKETTNSRGLFGSNYVHEGSLYVATDDNVYNYALEGSALSRQWGKSLRDRVDDLVVTGDAIYATGDAGVFKLTMDGETEWWAQTDGSAGRATPVGDAVAVMDDFLQLYAIDARSGETVTKRTLSSEGARAPIASIGRVVLTTKDPITAYRFE